jgi:GNAT superfamily N-acetyltransferase
MKTYKTFLEDTQTALSKISANWERKHPGMKFHVYQAKSGDIDLHSIEVPKEKRGSGIGSRALKGLTKFADRNNKRIGLTQQPQPGYKKKLDTFYKKFGFRANKGRSKDYSTSAGSLRDPIKKSSTDR